DPPAVAHPRPGPRQTPRRRVEGRGVVGLGRLGRGRRARGPRQVPRRRPRPAGGGPLSRTPCPVETCDRPATGGLMCGACVSELRRALDAVAELAAELDVTLSRQTPRGATAGRSSVVPLPYDPRASEAAYVLRSTLAGWVRALRDQNPDPPDDT